MDAETIRIVMCVNTSYNASRQLMPCMDSIKELNRLLAQNPTTEKVELGVVGFDDVSYVLRPLHPVLVEEELPGFPLAYGMGVTDPRVLRFPAGGDTLLSTVALMKGIRLLWPSQNRSDSSICPSHSFLVLLTPHVSPSASFLADNSRIPPEKIPFLSLNEIYAQQDIQKHLRKGDLTFLPFCIDSTEKESVLAALNFPGFPAINVSSSQLKDCAARLCQLVQHVMTYAPGKAPAINVSEQFIPGQPVSYPPAPPLEFCPSVFEWEDVH